MRDRLRQQNLEDKGWRFHRIWSTAWFRDRDVEVDRAVEAWRQACRESDTEASASAAEANPRQGAQSAPYGPAAVPPAACRRDRPAVRAGLSIDQYPHRQLVALVRWIRSDTLLRTDDELHREMRQELGFKRGGSRINPAIQRAIDEERR